MKAPDKRGVEASKHSEFQNGRPASQGKAPRGQAESFDGAARLFRTGRFEEARGLFVQAQSGPDRTIAHNAELHIRMCDRRLESPAVVLHTPEERYNYAVALINARQLSAARQHLQAALSEEPEADHIYYALALCLGLSGDLHGAYENLKRAIELQPRNRITARQDADFAGIIDRAPLDRLVFPERKTNN
ncbi:MAG TPA: hypothetical protein VG672_17515 [Bryobacteraceae bacterium]|jgi:tetratricopeptide (TPR) repeat protein|nr:hypothetical protein [Bryobacteraceae bacterium]